MVFTCLSIYIGKFNKFNQNNHNDRTLASDLNIHHSKVRF